MTDRSVEHDLATLADADLDSRMHAGAVDVLDECPDGVRLVARIGFVAVPGDDLEVGRCRATAGHEPDRRVDPG